MINRKKYVPNSRFLISLTYIQTLSKITKNIKQNTAQSLRIAISRSKNQNSHLQIMVWLDINQRVPNVDNKLQREITVMTMPFFVAI